MGTAADEGTQQNTVLATYRVRPGAEAAFADILRAHWPTLHRLSMVEDTPPAIFRQDDGEGHICFVEIFTWKPGAARRAHEHPEVAATWETMGPHLEAHGDKPAMEFPHFRRWDG